LHTTAAMMSAEVSMKQSARPAVWAVVVAGVLATTCGGGGGGSYGGTTTPNPPAATNPPASAGTVVVGVLGDRGANSFAPNPASVKVGQTVAWKNQDGIVHRIVQDKDGTDPGDGYGYGGGGGTSGSGFDGGETMPGGTSGAMTLSSAGTFRYHCAIHPGMVGSVTVQ